MAGEVLISHVGGETGQTSRLETLTVSVRRSSSDYITPALIDVPLSIAALDNSPPSLLIGSHLVVMAEADAPVSLGPDVIWARDRDTSPQRLTFFVTQTPLFGRLEKRSAATTTSRRGLHRVFYVNVNVNVVGFAIALSLYRTFFEGAVSRMSLRTETSSMLV